MSKRQVHPALYEVIRTRGAVRSMPAAQESPGGPPGEPTPVSPTRFVRVPVGYLWIGATVALVALIGSYMFGYYRGDAAADDRRSRELQEQMRSSGAGSGVMDPLVPAGSGTSGAEGGAAGADGDRAARRDGPGATAAPAGRGGSPPPPAPPGRVSSGDPRQDGLHYFVLAHPAPDRAGDMVAFLRTNGLDARLVPDHNGTLRKVIVLPGFAGRRERTAEQIKSLEAAIRSVGLKWKDAARGNTDFGDYYPEKYRAPGA